MKPSAIFCLLITCLVLSACRGAAEKKTEALPPEATTAPASPTPFLSPTLPPAATLPPISPPSARRSPTPFLTPSPTLSPTPRLVPVLEPGLEISPSMVTSATMHSLILFSSRDLSPFAGSYTGKAYPHGRQGDYIQIFAVSTDGRRAGRLGGIDDSFLALFPSRFFSAVLAIQYSTEVGAHHLPLSKIPAECYTPLEDISRPCSGFQFSPSEEFYGYQYGVDLRIVSGQTGKIVFSSDFAKIGPSEGLHFFFFTPHNRVLMGSGAAEGGDISLIDPKNPIKTRLGPESAHQTVTWNPQRTAFAVLAREAQSLNANIWGYNLSSDRVFLNDEGVIEAFTWTPDGSSVLYQKADILYEDLPDFTTYGVVQLMLAPVNGVPYQLLGHRNYDFRLCYGLDLYCGWLGNWYPVRRVPASLRQVSQGERDDCLSYGIGCPGADERFLINWHTGNLAPPDFELPPTPTTTPAPSPSPTPTPAPAIMPGPDLSREPVYAPPSGAYAFYVGLDGSSLWLVPRVGEPQVWVGRGENFIYVP